MNTQERNRILLSTGRDPVAENRRNELNLFHALNPTVHEHNPNVTHRDIGEIPGCQMSTNISFKNAWDPHFDNTPGSEDRKVWLKHLFNIDADPLVKRK